MYYDLSKIIKGEYYMSRKLRVIHFHKDDNNYIHVDAIMIEPKLESYQKLVGGLIELTYPFGDKPYCVVCNDEGKLLNLPPLVVLTYEGGGEDVICGDFFIAKLCQTDEGEDFTSISPKEALPLIRKHIRAYRGEHIDITYKIFPVD